MVYTQLSIVLGVVIPFDYVKSIIDHKKLKDIEEKFVVMRFADEDVLKDCFKGKNDMHLFNFPCCSESGDDKFILGYEVHKYYRKLIKCENCKEYSVCDKCIGYTNNGYYDVNKILNEPIEVNIRHMCLYCYSDNRKDLGGLEKTYPIIKNSFVCGNREDDEKKFVKCDTCGNLPVRNRCPEDGLANKEYKYDKIRSFLKKNKMDLPIKLYYMVNDCLSCT